MAFSPHLYTPTRHAGVIESWAGVSERWPRVSILLITILLELYEALSLSLGLSPSLSLPLCVRDKGRKQMRRGCEGVRVEGGEHINGRGSSCRVITWLNDQRVLRNSGTICSVFQMCSRKCVKYMAMK